MFEQAFAWSMRHGPRILFAAACMMLFAGLVSFTLMAMANYRLDSGGASYALTMVYSHLAPAAYLFFGAVLTEYLRRKSGE
jgi:hypothetical protein